MSLFAVRGVLASLDGPTLGRLTDRLAAVPDEVTRRVDDIEKRVRADGDAALVALAAELDKATIPGPVVPPVALEAAWIATPASVRLALESARDTLTRYHRAAMPAAGRVDDALGVSCAWRHEPVERAGIYAPGGRHPYPSTVLMTAIPAAVAGVADVWLASPPRPDGEVDPLVLAAAHLCGVHHVVRAGGAQAVFALAHGTATIPVCDVVVGPGNAYVQAAKQRVASTCRIDSPAGPSEVLILADEAADPRRVAAELLAQAEHGPDTFCAAVVPSEDAAEAVEAEVARQAAFLATADVARAALSSRGALLVEPDPQAQVRFANAAAPEHVLVLRSDGGSLANGLRHAGCVFVGPHATVVLGDYAAGPSHVLPTAGAARRYSGLGVDTFLRRTNIVTSTRAPPPRLANAAATLAAVEGLPAHAAAIEEALRHG